MSKITITFDGLCMFFTNRLTDPNKPQLMVGLLDLLTLPELSEEELAKDMHEPIITIKSGQRVIKKYQGFAAKADKFFKVGSTGELFGDIFLDIPYGSSPLKPYEGATDTEEIKNNFSRLFDIPSNLSQAIGDGLLPGIQDQTFQTNLDKFSARLHFRNGEVYAVGPLRDVALQFGEAEDNNGAAFLPAMIGLEMEIPDAGYAVLNFPATNTESFVFKGGLDYHVTITNDPAQHQHQHAEEGEETPSAFPNHFHYLYNTLEPPVPRSQMILPFIPETTGGGAFCTGGGNDGAYEPPFPPLP